MGDRVRITDVSPRDGLQNEPGVVPTDQKAELVELLCKTGVDEVEVTSFVSPKWIPALADSRELCEAVAPLWPRTATNHGPQCSVLVPNQQGLEAAIRCNQAAVALTGRPLIDKVSVFVAASETFSLKNGNATIAQTLDRLRPVVSAAFEHGLRVRGYVSCVITCPFEGPIQPERVIDVCWKLAALTNQALDEIDLGDTIGAGTPDSIGALILATSEIDLVQDWALHLHDTFGHAADCVRAALDLGVRSFDGSVAGLGGCPYASRPGTPAPGNIDTQLLVRTIHSAGYETGVDLDALARAAEFARRTVSQARSDRAPGGAAP